MVGNNKIRITFLLFELLTEVEEAFVEWISLIFWRAGLINVLFFGAIGVYFSDLKIRQFQDVNANVQKLQKVRRILKLDNANLASAKFRNRNT